MLKVKNKHRLVTVILLTEAVGLSSPCSSFAHLSGQVIIYIKYKRKKNTSFLSLINLNVSRAQHDTLSKKGIVIFDDNDATGIDNKVIDQSG